MANHTDSFFFISGIQIAVERGQIARSQLQLAERWGWDVKTVNEFLKTLEKNGYIRFEKYPKKNPKLTVITLLKYETTTRVPTPMENGIPSGLDYEEENNVESGVETYNNEENDENENNNKKSIIKKLDILKAQILNELEPFCEDFEDIEFWLIQEIMVFFDVLYRYYCPKEEFKTPRKEMALKLMKIMKTYGYDELKPIFKSVEKWKKDHGWETVLDHTLEEEFLFRINELDAKKSQEKTS